MKTKGRRQSKNVESRGAIRPNPFDIKSGGRVGESVHPAMRKLRDSAVRRKIEQGASKTPPKVAEAMEKAAEADRGKRMRGPRLPRGNPFDKR